MGDKWIKIALKVKSRVHLTQLDINLSVEEILQGICEEHGVTYQRGMFALKVQDFCKIVGTEYVTEENKCELKHGRQLKLSKSPTERVGTLIDRLHRAKDAEGTLKILRTLAAASRDSVMLREMHRQNALQHLRVFASVRSLSEAEYYRVYKIIGQFLARDYVKQLCEDEVNYLVELITCDKKITREMLLLAFELLVLLKKKGQLHWPMKFLRKLTPYVRLYEESKLQEKSLQLINCLYLYANDPEERKAVGAFMRSSIMVTYINKYVIRGNLSESMKQQLYLYQKIILRKYNKQLEVVNLKEEKILENLEYVVSNIGLVNQVREMRVMAAEMRRSEEGRGEDRAQQILRSLKLSLSSVGRARATSTPSSPTGEERKFRERFRSQDGEERKSRDRFRSQEGEESKFRERLRSQDSDCENEFLTRKIEQRGLLSRATSVDSSEAVGLSDEEVEEECAGQGILRSRRCELCEPEEVPALARDNLYYFIINDFRSFKKLLLMHRDQLKSVLRVGTGITRLLCRIFEIQEKEPEVTRGRFVPLCFLYYDYIVERMFCIALKRFHLTMEEMKVSLDSCEFLVVLKTVEDQFTLALESEPIEFEELEKRLGELSANIVFRKREALIKEEVQRQMTRELAFVELKGIVTPRITEMIREKRLRFMEAGEHAPQFDYKGQRISGKKWFMYLSKAHDRFVIEECPSTTCMGHHKVLESVMVSDIREVESGNKSNFHKEVYYNLCTERDMFFRPGFKQQEPDLRHPISIRLHSLNYVDFSAGNSRNMDYWVDGLNYLTGEKMRSISAMEELDYLLDIELMTHLAEVEGIELPEKAPVVPPLPEDFDFATP